MANLEHRSSLKESTAQPPERREFMCKVGVPPPSSPSSNLHPSGGVGTLDRFILNKHSRETEDTGSQAHHSYLDLGPSGPFPKNKFLKNIQK